MTPVPSVLRATIFTIAVQAELLGSTIRAVVPVSRNNSVAVLFVVMFLITASIACESPAEAILPLANARAPNKVVGTKAPLPTAKDPVLDAAEPEPSANAFVPAAVGAVGDDGFSTYNFSGRSAYANVRNVGVPAEPFGAANTVLADCEANVAVNVPVVVTGVPDTLKIPGKDKPTLVTPVLFNVIEPAAFVMLIPVPAVNVAATGADPVEPINNWPFVGAVVVFRRPATPEYKKLLAVKPETVKLVVTVAEPGNVTAFGKLNVTAPVAAEAVI